jgi:alpha-L-fucosidase 2
MPYELLVRASSSGGAPKISCQVAPVLSTATPITGQAPKNATLVISGSKEVVFTWVGGTSYNIDAGDAAHKYSFAGPDPHDALEKILSSAAGQSYASARAAHVRDFTATVGAFSLNLGQKTPADPTDVLLANYQVDIGNPYLEWVTFNYGRYMLASSARGVLPANLQGKWAYDAGAPWSGGEDS